MNYDWLVRSSNCDCNCSYCKCNVRITAGLLLIGSVFNYSLNKTYTIGIFVASSEKRTNIFIYVVYLANKSALAAGLKFGIWRFCSSSAIDGVFICYCVPLMDKERKLGQIDTKSKRKSEENNSASFCACDCFCDRSQLQLIACT